MKGISRLKRAAVLFGIGAMVVGGAVLGSTAANAAVGTDLGKVTLNPTSGNTAGGAITYSTSEACPTGFQTSAVLRIIDPATGQTSNLTAVNNSVASPFTGTLNADILNTEATGIFTDLPGSTAEIAVLCASAAGAGGNTEYVQDSYLTFSADGSTYVETNTPPSGPPANVSVALTAAPSPATAGQSVTLTATVTPANATGTIQFAVGGTAINGPATIAGGTASTNFTFSGITSPTVEALTATYTPSGNFAATTPGTFSLTVNPAAPNSGTIPLAVVVPQSGTFTLTVDTTDYVVLTVNTAGTTGTANTTAIGVSDTRNFYPGWSVSGQATKWQGLVAPLPAGYPTVTGTTPADHASQTIAADQLGWQPTDTALAPGVTLGGPVTAGTATNGLGDAAQVLASVHAGTGNGFGTTTLGASLTLAIPAGTEAGPYAAGLNITSVNALP
jgi:hypothetical protein